MKYREIKNSQVQGIGAEPVVAKGCGTIIINFAVRGKNVQHQL
jgi:hypothetical protein